jgi:hypothetical protein
MQAPIVQGVAETTPAMAHQQLHQEQQQQRDAPVHVPLNSILPTMGAPSKVRPFQKSHGPTTTTTGKHPLPPPHDTVRLWKRRKESVAPDAPQDRVSQRRLTPRASLPLELRNGTFHGVNMSTVPVFY